VTAGSGAGIGWSHAERGIEAVGRARGRWVARAGDSGCGKKDSAEDRVAGAAEARPHAAAAGPTIDCDAFAARMNQCLDQFVPLYARTDRGKLAGQDQPGTFDYGKAAKRFEMLWQLEGVKLCSGDDTETPYAERDVPWKQRFAACAAETACDAWAPCMATALGAPM
jgi:hypothetical protein